MRYLTSLLILLLILASFSGLDKPSYAFYKSPTLGVIKKPFARGCGCNLQFPNDYNNRNESYAFISCGLNTAQINIDGKDLMLKLIDRTEPEGELKVGYRSSETYVSGKTKVRVDYVVMKSCDPSDEQCEVTLESATITVHHNGRRRVVNTIGLCGS